MVRKGELDAILAKPYAVEFIYGETPDEGVVAQVAEWPGCNTAGATREEAIAHLEGAMHDWAEARLRAKLDIPEPMASYSGKVLLRMPRDVHRAAEQRARREGTSLNTWLATAIARELGPARDRKARALAPRRTRRKAARPVRT
jgi:antitoxin HicB